MATFDWNQWQLSTGISGNFRLESVATFNRNTQLMKPLSGNSSDASEFGHIIRDHIAQLHSTYGTTYLVADSALYSEDNLALLKDLPMKWITRVPATLNEVKAALAQADPEQMVPLKAGYRGANFDVHLWRRSAELAPG